MESIGTFSTFAVASKVMVEDTFSLSFAFFFAGSPATPADESFADDALLDEAPPTGEMVEFFL